ncbi:hypothetical protein IAE22_28680, partial [Bacillus sp. S34]|nr:hypothetical protein [Bacillus sp. S34]
VLQGDKDDCAYKGLVKFDMLGLGMLAALQYSFDLADEHCGERWDMHSIPKEEQGVYDQLCRADTIGVFQTASSVGMALFPLSLALLDTEVPWVLWLLTALVFAAPESALGEEHPPIVPGSTPIAVDTIVDPDTNAYLRGPALERAFAEVLDAEEIVTYCGVGSAACVDALALTVLGHEKVRVYDGSLLDWWRAGATFAPGDRRDTTVLRELLRPGADLLVDTVGLTRDDALQLRPFLDDVGSTVFVSSKAVYAAEHGLLRG